MDSHGCAMQFPALDPCHRWSALLQQRTPLEEILNKFSYSVIQMLSEASLDSYLGCANHLPTIAQGSSCLPRDLFLIRQCILFH